MIENLISNGCSYTAESQHCTTWSRHLSQRIPITHYQNLAMGGAGNRYICCSTIEYLESSDLDPGTTLVLIMWSGISRKDIMISKDWAQQFRSTYGFVPQQNYPINNDGDIVDDIVYYLLSGGQSSGGWIENPSVSQVFHALYRISDERTLCKESLFDFLNLENYLKINGYRYKFTSFMNLWNPSQAQTGFGEQHIDTNYTLNKNFDFSNWIFVDTQKNGLAEFALKRGLMQGHHPIEAAHEQFVDEILLPQLQEYLK